jgi:hypothetical protein
VTALTAGKRIRRTGIKKLLIVLGIVSAAICVVVLMVVAPGPALQGWGDGGEARLAYERSIEETAKPSEAPSPALPSEGLAGSAPDAANAVQEDLAKRDAWAAVSPEAISLEDGVEAQITVTEDGIGSEERAIAEPELVQVTISGAEMRSEATDEAPLLFAFPYGRTLQVVSRGEGWVEVTDPKSGATGWMKTAFLAVPRYSDRQTEAAFEPRWRRGWLRRPRGGVSDFFERAFGGL